MPDHSTQARAAIEAAFAGEPEALERYYDPDFVDHINAMEFSGHAGIREAAALYRRLFSEPRLVVERQVASGEQVASHWTLHGRYRGRDVRLSSIVISRFAGERIIESWAATDSVELVRQLGAWRSFLMCAGGWRELLALGQARVRPPSD